MGPSLTTNFASGKNAHGVDVVSLNLTIQQAAADSIANSTNVRAWGFGITGADSKSDRTTDIRNGFSFFSGIDASIEAENLSVAVRRRLVILQGVDGGLDGSGVVIPQWRILYSSNDPDSSAMVNVINSVHPAPVAQTFDAWKIAESIPAGMDGPFQDADGDGDENIKEFYFFTSPTDGQSRSQPVFESAVSSGFEYTFRRAKGITGVEMKLKSSADLLDWSTEITLTESNTTVVDKGDYEEITVTLPAGTGKKFYRIELTESTE